MLISLQWIRDFVDLPSDLDVRQLAEKFTRRTAEVDSVLELKVGAQGLIVARVESFSDLPGGRYKLAVLNIGGGKTVETVTAAPTLHMGWSVVYAPTGSKNHKFGAIKESQVAGHRSCGMILPGEAVGIALATWDAVFVGHDMEPGQEIAGRLFDDWLIEVDNKSLTNRPDLWGHYGIAREMAALVGRPLKPYPICSLEELLSKNLPEVPVSIADPAACPRYSGLVLEGVPLQPAPLWMQLRLGRVGMRPISGLVDLTNYIMADLGQPMHAFDARKVTRIEVAYARAGESFKTLDGVERALLGRDLVIQSNGKSVALAGVMGGLDSEVSSNTTSLLLESANFEAATIRRTAARLGLRTDASARFEKSLDPQNTVLAIQRFVHLARAIYSKFQLTSRLSDCYPKPAERRVVAVNPRHVCVTLGRDISAKEAGSVLAPLGFELREQPDRWDVQVPSFRASGDVTIEPDVIEEMARCIGYDNIVPALPQTTMRHFEPNGLAQLERWTLEFFTSIHGFHEVQGYNWSDAAWLEKLGIDPGRCVELRNPASEGLHLLRRTLMPGLLAAVVRNRFHFSSFAILEVGSVFEKTPPDDGEFRHLGLVAAKRGKANEKELVSELKGALEVWVWDRFGRGLSFARRETSAGWEGKSRGIDILLQGQSIGMVSVVDIALRRAMDDHLAAWSIVGAEIRLSGLENMSRLTERLQGIPEFPLVDLDFSVVVPKSTAYGAVTETLASFRHPLLKMLRFSAAFEGGSLPSDRRSLTFRAILGDSTRTLAESDLAAFRGTFLDYIQTQGFEVRS